MSETAVDVAEAEVEEVTTPSGYGVFASDARAVFEACPALTDHSIDIDCRQNNKPQTHYVSSAVYGDEFWEAVAEHCPLLESIEMIDASDHQNFSVQAVKELSDRTLTALASLKYLTVIDLCAVRLTGQGIFDWLCHVTKFEGSVGPERMLSVLIGVDQRTRLAQPRFYAAIVELLRLLSEISEAALEAAACRTKPLIYIHWEPVRVQCVPYVE
ncbi:hypothetical protein GN244_ATG01589 [Phytophthora infestans]|uniref:Uncharacterized protein n=1 Tax=Phytophthora infestans TaxID=4787 RepID=A0A833TMI8_PHYIN|nr:hypothetical protein GN244_ATG01589 [Phytophthora infestans]KAF4131852.1 hypothetical protein GN958_ATG18885 [Phytophthora infestans]